MPKPCIIITRPIVDAARTAELLNAHGLEYFIEPVLTVDFLLKPQEIKNKICGKDGIIITSKNAARAGIEVVNKDTKIICLGKATTTFLAGHGFTNAEYGGDNITQLCQYTKDNYTDNNFVYLSGESITQELNHKNCGNHVTRVVLYKTTPAKHFSNEFVNKLKRGDFNAVMLFSKKTAMAFYKLIKAEGLELDIENLYAFCFSPAIASCIKSYGFKATISTKNSNLEENIEFIARFWFS